VSSEPFPLHPPRIATETPVVGWREWVALPGIGLGAIRTKLDSGARTSSLRVESIEAYLDAGATCVRFHVRPRRNAARTVACSAPVVDRRRVTDSGGHREQRWFVLVEAALAGERFEMEMNLSERGTMRFPLLLGRSAVAGRFRIDPALSYTCPRPQRMPRPR